MGERSIHGVQIALRDGTISIPWKSRQALLAELRPTEAMREVVVAFESVGTSRPAQLTAEGRPPRRAHRLVAAHLFDEPLGVLAADEDLERVAEQKVARENVVDDGVDDHRDAKSTVPLRVSTPESSGLRRFA